MPFRSKKQRRYLYANEPKVAERFEAHTPKGAKLPERAAMEGPGLTGGTPAVAIGAMRHYPTPSEVKAAMEFEASRGGDESERAGKVANHLQERPGYYDELREMLTIPMFASMSGDGLAYKRYLAEGHSPEEADRLAGKMAGPFIGPKGGKWADAAHTVPWHEGSTARTALRRELEEYEDSIARLRDDHEHSKRAWAEHRKRVREHEKRLDAARTRLDAIEAEGEPADEAAWNRRWSAAADEVVRLENTEPEEPELPEPEEAKATLDEALRDEDYLRVKNKVAAFDRVRASRVQKSGGPYIGPRGGKWADPQHTIPWHEPEHAPSQPRAHDVLTEEEKKLAIEDIVEIKDTRERELVEGYLGIERSRPIPGSGTLSVCARCGKEHEVHATVRLSNGKHVVMGTGCAKKQSPETASRISSLERAAKALGKAAHELAAARRQLTEIKERNAAAEKAQSAMHPPDIIELTAGDPRIPDRNLPVFKFQPDAKVFVMGDESIVSTHEWGRRQDREMLQTQWRRARLKDLGWQSTKHLEEAVDKLSKRVRALTAKRETAMKEGIVKSENAEPAKPKQSEGQQAQPPKQSGGPYIGPKGGKWADPQFTIPWHEGGAQPSGAQPQQATPPGPTQQPPAAATSKPLPSADQIGMAGQQVIAMLRQKGDEETAHALEQSLHGIVTGLRARQAGAKSPEGDAAILENLKAFGRAFNSAAAPSSVLGPDLAALLEASAKTQHRAKQAEQAAGGDAMAQSAKQAQGALASIGKKPGAVSAPESRGAQAAVAQNEGVAHDGQQSAGLAQIPQAPSAQRPDDGPSTIDLGIDKDRINAMFGHNPEQQQRNAESQAALATLDRMNEPETTEGAMSQLRETIEDTGATRERRAKQAQSDQAARQRFDAEGAHHAQRKQRSGEIAARQADEWAARNAHRSDRDLMRRQLGAPEGQPQGSSNATAAPRRGQAVHAMSPPQNPGGAAIAPTVQMPGPAAPGQAPRLTVPTGPSAASAAAGPRLTVPTAAARPASPQAPEQGKREAAPGSARIATYDDLRAAGTRAPRLRRALISPTDLKKAYGQRMANPPPMQSAGAAPVHETPALPDYQELYYQPPDDPRKVAERNAEGVRRMADAERANGSYGFHGTGEVRLDPILYYVPQVRPQVYGPELSARKPLVVSDMVQPRMQAGASSLPKDGVPVDAQTDAGRVPRSPDRRDDQLAPTVRRPEPMRTDASPLAPAQPMAPGGIYTSGGDRGIDPNIAQPQAKVPNGQAAPTVYGASATQGPSAAVSVNRGTPGPGEGQPGAPGRYPVGAEHEARGRSRALEGPGKEARDEEEGKGPLVGRMSGSPRAGHKYTRRVPTGNPDRPWRYYYAESAAARDVTEGEEVRIGKHETAKVQKVETDGTIHVSIGGETRAVKPDEWANLLVRSYGTRYHEWAEKRAEQSINAVLKHVPRAMLEDLPGETDEARFEALKQRVPAVYAKLDKAFKRAGVHPFRAKQILATALERRGWEPEARAAAVGSVLTKRTQATRFSEIVRGAENLAGGARVTAGHVAAVVELRGAGGENDDFAERVEQLQKRAEKELAELAAALSRAKDGSNQDRAEALAKALASSAVQKLAMLATAFPGIQDDVAQHAQNALTRTASITPHPEPKRIGGETHVYVAGEGGQPKALRARYRLMDASEIIASHDPLKGFAKREHYPEGVQERAYHRDQAEQAKVIRNAQALNPAFVANTNPDAVNGPPVVMQTEKGAIALGGNSRTMSMQRAYAHHNEKGAELVKYLKEHAHEFGFRPEDVDAMHEPVLVREIDPEDRSKEAQQLLVRQLNESFTQGMDPRTMQVAMGRKLDENALSALGNDMQGDETLAAFLGSPRSERFVNALQRAGIIDQRNANQYLKKGTKLLNEDGRTLVERILVGRVVGDADVLSNTGPRLVGNIASAVPYMVQAKAYGEGFDVGNDLATALSAYNDLQHRVETNAIPALDPKMPPKRFDGLFNYFDSLFGDKHPVVDNQNARALLELLIRKPGPQQQAAVWRDFVKRASQNPEGQTSMFGESKKPAAVLQETVKAALGRADDEPKAKPAAESPGLF